MMIELESGSIHLESDCVKVVQMYTQSELVTSFAFDSLN